MPLLHSQQVLLISHPAYPLGVGGRVGLSIQYVNNLLKAVATDGWVSKPQIPVISKFSLRFNGHFSRSAGFIEAKHDGGDGDNWSYVLQSSSQIVTTNKPTPNFLQAGCPSCRPTNSMKTMKGYFHTFCTNDAQMIFVLYWFDSYIIYCPVLDLPEVNV